MHVIPRAVQCHAILAAIFCPWIVSKDPFPHPEDHHLVFDTPKQP